MTIEDLLIDLATRKAQANYEEMVAPYRASYNKARDAAFEVLCGVLGPLCEGEKIPLDKYPEAMAAWKTYQESIKTSREAFVRSKTMATKQLESALNSAKNFNTSD